MSNRTEDTFREHNAGHCLDKTCKTHHVTEATTLYDHELKCWPMFYGYVENGTKNFELRKNDRGFIKGEVLLIREWDGEKGYSGRQCLRTIMYVLSDAEPFGLKAGYCVLGLEPYSVQHG